MVDVITHSFHIVAATQAQTAASRVAASWKWYVIRASGFTGAGLLVLLMLSGIGQVTGITYRFMEPLVAWAVHKAMALALAGAIVVHMLFLFLDHYIPFTLPKLFVPFVSHYTNNVPLLGLNLSLFGVALGILAAYGVGVIIASSLGWINTKKAAWRKLHYVSYFVMAAVLLHGLIVGSDLKYGLFRAAWLGLALLVLVGVVSRLWRSRTLKQPSDEA